MIIPPLLSINPYSNKNKPSPRSKSFFVNNNLSFKGNPLQKLDYDDFLQKFKTAYSQKLEDVLYSIIGVKEHLLGAGCEKSVYKIPKVNDYVVTYPKNQDRFQYMIIHRTMKPAVDKFPEHNFGQAVGDNGGGVYILKKVNGIAHSFPDWITKFSRLFKNNMNVDIENAEIFVNQLKKISEFPQKAFEKLAEELQLLNQASIRADAINPNNLLVDDAKKIFTLIDIDQIEKQYPYLNKPYNGTMDMITILLDPIFHYACYKKLQPDKQKELIFISNTIIAKCKTAAKKIGLPFNSQNNEKIFLAQNATKMPENPSKVLMPPYNKFKELYPALN